MSDATKAVFVSYAREDTDAARRIAEALRSHGVEVWFDQNELRGGDAWDGKIRRQIKECALFLPVISGRTQDRTEGYFRLEWKLAVERTHLMAEGMAYLAPVAIDDTAESSAVVPPEFMKVQWTRLPGALPSPQFVEQIKRLLNPSVTPDVTASPFSMRAKPAAVPVATSIAKFSFPTVITAALGLAVLALVGYVALRPAAKEAPPLAVSAKPVPESKPVPATGSAVSDKSVAVLPFANMSTDKENEFFADGVQDDVITNLAKIRELTVISRTSTLAYRDTASRNLKRIGSELGVATILEGSVRRVGSKVHMNAQLIDARTDAHLWADSFDGDASDIFALQASLAQKIAAALKATLTPGERTLIERRPTQNQEAYDLYLRARVMQEEQGESGSLGDYEKILAVYQQAAAKDPTFALPHVQSAIVHLIVYWIANLDPSRERMTRAKAAVDAAVRLAPDAPETHLALGAYHYRVELDWNRALAEFRAAESSLPNQAQLCFWLAVTHRRLGKWSEALGYFERAAVLNPRELVVITNHSAFLTDLRRWGQARDTNAKYLRYFSSNRELLTEQARATFALDGDRAAWAHATEALPPDSFNASAVGDKYRATLARGDLGAADQVLAGAGLATLVEFERHVINDPVTFHRAYIAFVRGERDVAERLADQAIAFYRNTQWNVRQTPWVRMRIAQAEAWAGRADSAGRDAEAAFTAMTAQDAFDSVILREYLGEVNIATGRREGALACLREMMIQPCFLSPNDIRIHPLWSRLKDDPRFEEILKSAKAL